MRGLRGLLVSLLTAATLFATGCRDADEATEYAAGTATEPLSVYVVNYPLQYFAERIGGDHVNVSFPAPAEVDPADWTPEEDTVRAYQQADVILLHGAGYARWRTHVSLPAATTVNTAHGLEDRLIEAPDATVHAHGPDGDMHAHAGTATMTWLDPMFALEHARAIKQAFSERLPDHQDAFAERFESLAQDLRALDDELREIVAYDPDQPLLASYPLYHYLEAGYALNLESLHWPADATPEDIDWDALEAEREDHPAAWMLWPREPMPETADRLREHGIEPVVYAPAAQPPDDGDLLTVMRENAANLRVAFTGE